MADVLAGLRESLGGRILATESRSPRQTYVSVSCSDIPDAARCLFERLGGRLATVTGLDERDGIELLYHFCFDAERIVLTVKTKVAKPDPRISSITPFLPGAEWIEREIHDLLGVRFDGHPRPERLILADDWPEGVYPLRKDGRP
jgi:Ni,Fe-hydrogenase III component G